MRQGRLVPGHCPECGKRQFFEVLGGGHLRCATCGYEPTPAASTPGAYYADVFLAVAPEGGGSVEVGTTRLPNGDTRLRVTVDSPYVRVTGDVVVAAETMAQWAGALLQRAQTNR